jgi:hypothetical protein
VVLGSVHHHPAPPAADVEQTHAGPEVELAADQLVLGLLRSIEADVGALPHAAGVGHRAAQEQAVEVVRDVIVVRNRRRVARLRVAAAVESSLLTWWRKRSQPRRHDELEHGPPLPWLQAQAREAILDLERFEDVALEIEIAGHVRPAEPELTRGGGQTSERVRRSDDQRRRRVGRTGAAPVERLHGDRPIRPDQRLNQ